MEGKRCGGEWGSTSKVLGELKLQFLGSIVNKLVGLNVYEKDVHVSKCFIGEISGTACIFTSSV